MAESRTISGSAVMTHNRD